MRLIRLAFKRFISEEHRRFLAEERGSASVEFVVLALPLFIPIFIFLGQFSALSSHEMTMQTLARESLRAFVESNSDQSGGVLINEVINAGGEKLGLSEAEIKAIDVDIECSKSPCHTPNGRVRITLTMDPSVNHGRQVIAAAQEYFSPWIN
jgi:Flp pilus assembly protein TadG